MTSTARTPRGAIYIASKIQCKYHVLHALFEADSSESLFGMLPRWTVVVIIDRNTLDFARDKA